MPDAKSAIPSEVPAAAMVTGSGDAQVTAHGASTFADLGVCLELVDACDTLGWKQPTKIQGKAIPYALKGFCLIIFCNTICQASCNLYVIEIGSS
jgi:hypothetical protein